MFRGARGGCQAPRRVQPHFGFYKINFYETIIYMKRGPKVRYCYICRRLGPCGPQAACNRLKGAARKAAYASGYAVAHPDKFRAASSAAYRRKHPDAEPYKPLIDRIRDKPTKEQRNAADRAKRLPRVNARKADQEAE